MKELRFFYLYLAGALIAIAIILYDVLTTYPAVKIYSLILEIILGVFFLYMANKAYREKKDKDLM